MMKLSKIEKAYIKRYIAKRYRKSVKQFNNGQSLGGQKSYDEYMGMENLLRYILRKTNDQK
jgi:hypothetical protein